MEKILVLSIILALTLTSLAYAADPNFISHWKFDEGGGTTTYDSIGNNDGTIYGPAWTTGQINGALDFDGSNDYVEVLDPADDFWVKEPPDGPGIPPDWCGALP